MNTSQRFLFNLFFKHLPLLLIVMAVLQACSKFEEDFDFDKLVTPGWNPEFAIPLVNAEYAISDFFNESNQEFIQVDEDGFISLVYSSNQLSSARAEDFFFLEDRYFSHDFELFLLQSGTSDTLTGEFSYSFYSQANNQRIDTVIFKGGSYTFRGKTNLNKDNASLKLTIPEIINRQTGELLMLDISLNNPGGVNEWVNFEVVTSLDGYKLVINPNISGGLNLINVLSQLITGADQNPNLSPYSMEISGDMSGMEYSDFFGYMGTDSLNFVDSINIAVFNNSVGGAVEVGPGALKFITETYNAIGVPVAFRAKSIQVHSPFVAPYFQDIFLFGEGSPNEFTIQSPTPQQIGQSIYTRLDFSQTNFPEAFLNIAPNMFYYDFDVIMNDDGDSTVQNVLQDTSRIQFQSELEFKLFLAIDHLTIVDTLDFDLEANSVEEMDYLLCRVNAVNGFPLDATIQLYFTDANDQVLDSLIYDEDARLLVGGQVGLPPKLKVVKPSSKTTDIMITNQRLETITSAKKMIVKAGLATTNNQMTKIYDDYNLQIKIGAKTGLNISTNN